jgi:lipopolysaccharide transport system ATP-binding protein
VIVGGGHLVRFDKNVARGYGSTSTAVHHPTGYWLTPTLVAGAAGVPVVWNALGASPDTPA